MSLSHGLRRSEGIRAGGEGSKISEYELIKTIKDNQEKGMDNYLINKRKKIIEKTIN